MINLEDLEIEIIKICKGVTGKFSGSWIENLKPFYKKVYGGNPDDMYNVFLGTMFHVLLDVQIKISDDKTGRDGQIKEVFDASFNKNLTNAYESPIERAISRLCALIQCNKVIDDNGTRRYEL